MFMALHPRGRAWQSYDAAISATVVDANGEVTSTLPNSVMRAFWYAIAKVWAEFETAAASPASGPGWFER